MTHRIKELTSHTEGNGEYVLYWMQASVRVTDNLALVEALRLGAQTSSAVAVVFCLDPAFPEATARSFAFLLDGLSDVNASLASRKIPFAVVVGPPDTVIPVAADRARSVVFDKGYLPVQRRWRAEIAGKLRVPVREVEDNVAVPLALVSDHDEWMAATLRPKLMRLASLEPEAPEGTLEATPPFPLPFPWQEFLANQGLTVVDASVGRGLLEVLKPGGPVPVALPGGEAAALARWRHFRDEKLDRYNDDRNDPLVDGQSGLAPYLHFGQLSPLTIMNDLKKAGRWVEALSYRRAGEDPVSKFLDEVLVRRELSANFVWYNPDFATWAGLPAWARATLQNHRLDRRAYLYTDQECEEARTHDAAWNAAQTQLVETGTMHGYLRMYWGKKLLEWSADPAAAMALALRLNNRYALDGRDPNSWAGVAWCFGKHDRPWGERAVYGTVRCMTSGGLAKKFDLPAYVRRFSAP